MAAPSCPGGGAHPYRPRRRAGGRLVLAVCVLQPPPAPSPDSVAGAVPAWLARACFTPAASLSPSRAPPPSQAQCLTSPQSAAPVPTTQLRGHVQTSQSCPAASVEPDLRVRLHQPAWRNSCPCRCPPSGPQQVDEASSTPGCPLFGHPRGHEWVAAWSRLLPPWSQSRLLTRSAAPVSVPDTQCEFVRVPAAPFPRHSTPRRCSIISTPSGPNTK